MSRFINQFRYHAKRTFAIIFISLAIALQLANFILGVLQITSGNTISWSFIWNFVIMMICYVRILQGNIDNTTKAYSGVLMFVSLSAITLVFDVVASLFVFGFGTGADTTALIIEIAIFVLLAGEMTLAILTAVYFRRLLMGYGRTNIKTVKILAGFFFGLLILGQGFYIALFFVAGYIASDLLSIFLVLLSPLSEFFAAIAAWITLSRIE